MGSVCDPRWSPTPVYRDIEHLRPDNGIGSGWGRLRRLPRQPIAGDFEALMQFFNNFHVFFMPLSQTLTHGRGGKVPAVFTWFEIGRWNRNNSRSYRTFREDIDDPHARVLGLFRNFRGKVLYSEDGQTGRPPRHPLPFKSRPLLVRHGTGRAPVRWTFAAHVTLGMDNDPTCIEVITHTPSFTLLPTHTSPTHTPHGTSHRSGIRYAATMRCYLPAEGMPSYE